MAQQPKECSNGMCTLEGTNSSLIELAQQGEKHTHTENLANYFVNYRLLEETLQQLVY